MKIFLRIALLASLATILLASPAFAQTATINCSQLPDRLSTRYFNIPCDNSTDVASQIQTLFNIAKVCGKAVDIVGSCRATGQQLHVDLNGYENNGFTMDCPGGPPYNRLELEGNSANPPLLINDSGATGALYVRIGQSGTCDIQGNNSSGAVVQIGNEDYSDAINSSIFNMNVHNNATSGTNIAAIEGNYVLQSSFNGTVGNSGTIGDAIRIRKGVFISLQGSYGGANCGIHITGGDNGNINIDDTAEMEANTTDLCVDATSANVTSYSTYFSHYSGGHAVNTTSGTTLLINPYFADSTGQINGSTGLFIMGPGHNMPSGYPNYPTGSGTVTSVTAGTGLTGGTFTTTGTVALSTPVAVANGGTGVTSAQGNGSKIQLSTGTTTINDCVKFDANGNTVDAGSACGSGGAGSGSDILISTQTASNSASITFTGLPTTYDHYILRYTNVVPATNGVSFYAQVGESTGPTWMTSGYHWSGYATSEGGGAGVHASASDSGWNLTGNGTIANTANKGTSGVATFHSLSSSSQYKSYTSDYFEFGGTGMNMRGNYVTDANQVTGLKFYMSSGNISTGTFSLYGIVK